jgi:hypothetical protein
LSDGNPLNNDRQTFELVGSVLIWRGERIVLNPQRLDDADML